MLPLRLLSCLRISMSCIAFPATREKSQSHIYVESTNALCFEKQNMSQSPSIFHLDQVRPTCFEKETMSCDLVNQVYQAFRTSWNIDTFILRPDCASMRTVCIFINHSSKISEWVVKWKRIQLIESPKFRARALRWLLEKNEKKRPPGKCSREMARFFAFWIAQVFG